MTTSVARLYTLSVHKCSQVQAGKLLDYFEVSHDSYHMTRVFCFCHSIRGTFIKEFQKNFECLVEFCEVFAAK